MRGGRKMILLSVFCVVLSFDFGVSTPQRNRFKETSLQNEGNSDFDVERNIGDPMNPYNQPNNRNKVISQENQKSVLMQNEDYEQFYTNNNAAAFRNINQQPNVMPENKSYNQITDKRNFNTLSDESPRPSYIGSLPKVNKIQTFRPKNGINHEANIPRMGDIISEISEVNNPKNDFSPIESNPPIIQERSPAIQVINRENSQVPENLDDKKEEEGRMFDAPAATPEYIKSLSNEYTHTQKNNIKSTNKHLPRYNISNKNFKTNSQNVNEATFQNPSAEILYETGQAKPYEISNEPLFNSRKGNTHAQNILNDKQRLKNLYLSSKPTKHYMIVYPDGRVEQVDQLDKIQKMHPNYVMLNAKELLQHGKPNKKVSTLSQGSVMKQNLQITTTTTMKPLLNSIKDGKDNQIDNVPQAISDQTLPDPVAPEPSVISTTEVTKTNNVSKSNKDDENTNLTTEKQIQKQFQEDEVNENQEENGLIKNENANPETSVTTSDVSSVPISTTPTTETPVIEDKITTVRSTISTRTENAEFLNQNISNSLAMSNNTNSSSLLKETEERNSITSRSNLITANHIADENTTPIPKQDSNEEDERTKNTTTILVNSDLNTIQENSYTPDNIETSNVNNETNSSNSLPSNREESNSTMNSNNATIITPTDGIDSDGNTFHTEKIITNYNNESNSENLGSNNVISSDDSTTLVTISNKTDHANYSTEDTQNNTNPLNVTSADSLTNNTLDIPEKDENNTDTITIQIVSDIVNSEVDGTKKDGTSLNSDTFDINSDTAYKNASSYNTSGEIYKGSNTQEESNTNKTLSSTVKQDSFKYTDGGTADSDALPTGTPDLSNKEEEYAATNVSNGGANSSNEEDTTGTVLNDSYYFNSPKKGLIEDDEDYDNNETRSVTTNTNDNLETESDGNGVIEPSIWFNASDSFWNKLMNNNEHNSFYFLFPRPKPNTKDTKKIIYPNGTIVIETTETVDNGDGETTSSKTVFKCGNCTTCERIL